MNKPKTMLLRAFNISRAKEDITQYSNNLMSCISDKLEKTSLAERLMSLNKNEDVEDVISYYEKRENINVAGVILRLISSDESRSIPDSVFTQNKVLVSELDQLGTENTKSYRSHHYFLINNEFLITAGLPRNYTIERLQTYINWLLDSERGENLFLFTPITMPPPELKVSDIKYISVGNDAVLPRSNSAEARETSGKKLKITCLDLVKRYFTDIENVDELLLNDMISAELLIKFVKPKMVDKDQYNKILGTYLKSIGNTDDIAFKTKGRGTVKADDILKTKEIQVETIDNNEINEKSLYQQMEQFIYDIKE